MKKKSLRVLRVSLHKAYLDLLKKSFEFIKKFCIKNRDIHPKRDPAIYGSLVYECSLTDMKNKKNFLQKLFLKLKQNEFYEDYLISRELLQLLFLPSFNRVEYYILLQHHMLENGCALQHDLKTYFSYVNEELKIYFNCITKVYSFKKFDSLSCHMRLVNQKVKEFTKNQPLTKIPYQKIQGFKHQFLGIQLMLLKKISNVKTKKEIKKWCNELTIFVCKPDELFCGYI